MTVLVLYDKHQHCPLTALLAHLCSPPPPFFYFLVQEPEADDSGPGPGEVSSWDVNTERMTSTVGKLCKTESQNHMSPRYTAAHYIWKHAHKTVLCHHLCAQVTLDFGLIWNGCVLLGLHDIRKICDLR